MLILLLAPARADDPNAELMKSTGLQEVESGDVPTFGKTHRGYPLRLQIAAPNVWKRYFTRLAVSEASQGLPDAWRTLVFDRPGAGDIAGSRADQAISRVLGYPLILTVAVEHQTELSPLFIYSSASAFQPPTPPPYRDAIPGTALRLYCDDPVLVERVLANPDLVARLAKLRAPFVGLTPTGSTLIWAGDELQYSEMIREHSDYAEMFNAIFDLLVDLVETAPGE